MFKRRSQLRLVFAVPEAEDKYCFANRRLCVPCRRLEFLALTETTPPGDLFDNNSFLVTVALSCVACLLLQFGFKRRFQLSRIVDVNSREDEYNKRSVSEPVASTT